MMDLADHVAEVLLSRFGSAVTAGIVALALSLVFFGLLAFISLLPWPLVLPCAVISGLAGWLAGAQVRRCSEGLDMAPKEIVEAVIRMSQWEFEVFGEDGLWRRATWEELFGHAADLRYLLLEERRTTPESALSYLQHVQFTLMSKGEPVPLTIHGIIEPTAGGERENFAGASLI